MAGEGRTSTQPDASMSMISWPVSFTTGPDGKLYQLPDQQFANLYWFRKDWFDRADLQAQFKEKYGYDLGVPVNWSAYEDIAEFFSVHVKEIDGVRVYGHMDYGKRAPGSWLAHDRRLAVHGRRGLGGRAERRADRRVGHPHGGRLVQPGRRFSVSRGGGTNGPAAVYAIRKWDEWLRKYAPPGAALRLLPVAAGAQPGQCRPADLLVHGLHRLDGRAEVRGQQHRRRQRRAALADGSQSPHGPYWKDGQKVGYQDAGSWTLFKSTPVDRRKAAWLYAQFVVSKTVDVKKSHVGLTFIRDSTVRHESFTERAPNLGGLVEFYRSPDRVRWSPTGINVPDYPKLAQIWWQQIGDVNSGAFTPQQAMDRLAGEMDQVMARMQAADEQANVYGGCGPRLNDEKDPSEWLGKSDGPKAKLANEKPQGETIAYDELIKRWQSQ